MKILNRVVSGVALAGLMFSSLALASDKADVALLATGGTIAAAAKSNTDLVNYKVGELAVDTLIAAVPEMSNFANVKGYQVANIPSPDIDNATLLKLSKEVNEKSKSVDGIVITHGTDTLEETAFFLDLTTSGTKPVVLVGAMRPASAISADGSLNLLQAVSVASNPASKGRGTMVVMSDRILPAYYVVKGNTMTVDSFGGGEAGALGQMVGTAPKFFYTAAQATGKKHFDVSRLKELPKVSIVYMHTEADLPLFEAAIKNGAKGIVIAGSGNGSLPQSLQPRVKELTANGFPIVRSTRVAGGYVSKSEKMGGIGAGFLNPQKARILLSLALTETRDIKDLEKIFGTN